MSDLPVACMLSAAALRTRREGLLSDILRRADGRQQIPEGHRLRFAASEDILGIIARTVDAERQCCRFLRFQITVEPDGGAISLELSGPPGSQEFLSALFDA